MWKDKSGNGFDLTESDARKRPLWNGTVVDFSGGAKRLQSAMFPVGQFAPPLHLMLKCNLGASGPQAGGFAYIYDGRQGDTTAIGVNEDTVMVYMGQRFPNPSVPNFGHEQLIEVVFNGPITKFAANGADFVVGNAGGVKDPRGVTLGMDALQRDQYAKEDWTLSKLLLYRGEMSSDERMAAQDSLLSGAGPRTLLSALCLSILSVRVSVFWRSGHDSCQPPLQVKPCHIWPFSIVSSTTTSSSQFPAQSGVGPDDGVHLFFPETEILSILIWKSAVMNAQHCY